MDHTRENAVCIRDDIFWIGGDDRTASLFERSMPIPEGVSYNSYVILDEKTCLLDTCDISVAPKFWKNFRNVIGDRKLDYLVIDHMEPDHGAAIMQILEAYPEVTVVGNTKTFDMMENFYHMKPKNVLVVENGQEVTVQADGGDETAAMQEIEDFLLHRIASGRA